MGRAIHAVAQRRAAGIRIDDHVIVREVGHARLQAGKRRRLLAGATRPAQQNSFLAPSHQAGVQRLETPIAVPEEQLGMERPADVVLSQEVGVADPAHDALRLPVQSGLDLCEGGDDLDAAGGDLGVSGNRRVLVGAASRAADSGLRFIPQVDSKLTGRRWPIGDPEMRQCPGDEPGQPRPHDP